MMAACSPENRKWPSQPFHFLFVVQMWIHINGEQEHIYPRSKGRCSQPKVTFDAEREGVPTQIRKGRQLMNKTSFQKCRKVSCIILKLLPGNISFHNKLL